MDLAFTEAQEMLRTSARDFLSKECPYQVVRELERDEEGFSKELWRKVAGLGWLAIPFPEAYGGADGNLLDVVLLMEELGRAVFPGSYNSTVVLGGLAILDAGTEEQKRAHLPPLIQGERLLAFALTEPSVTYDAGGVQTSAVKRGDAYVINGVKLFVRDAQVADQFVCVARTAEGSRGEEGITVFLVDAGAVGIELTPLKGIGTGPIAEVVFNDVEVPVSNVLGEADSGWPIVARALERAVVATCAEMVGGAQKALEMTVEYSKQRVQFGVPIGSFQAVQHRCADMFTDVDTSRLLTYYAAWKLGEGPSASLEISIAKHWVSNAYKRVVRGAHQIHGGAGYLMDHNLQFYFRNAKASELYLGDANYQRRIIQKELGYV